MSFIINKGKKYRMYIASGSDGKELNEVSKVLELARIFTQFMVHQRKSLLY